MIIDGKKIADALLANLVTAVQKLSKPPRLVAVLVGHNSNSQKFLEFKKTAAEKIGMECKIYQFPEDITTQQLRKEVVALAKAQINDGILIELPLPSQINTQYILNAVPENKDVDVLSQKSQGAFFANRASILPPAVMAIKAICETHHIELKGKNCVVFGYGLLVGKPISHWLSRQNATVTVINEFTINPAQYSLQGDIIISGVGKPNLITADLVKPGAIVIDFGPDVDYQAVSPKASLITPPVGGVGPIVIASVLKNLVELKKA